MFKEYIEQVTQKPFNEAMKDLSAMGVYDLAMKYFEGWMSAKQMAEHLDYDVSNIQHLAKKGRIMHFKIGTHNIYRLKP